MPSGTRARALLAAATLVALVALPPLLSRPALAATFTVTTLADDGPGSLRQAIAAANATPGDDLITFAAATDGGALALASPLPAIGSGGALAIQGNGAARTTIDGAGVGPIFTVAAGATATIGGVTLTGGDGGSGGAISNAGALTVRESLIRGNEATNGGGIYNPAGARLTLISSAVAANAATVGGGIFGFGAAITLVNSTVSGNAAATGGGIFVNGGALTLNNSIVANSTSGGSDCLSAVAVLSSRNTLVEDGSCGVIAGLNGNLIGDPALDPDFTLSAASPAIDAGLDGLLPPNATTDLAGNARVFGARVDMGAYEFGAGPPPPSPSPTATTPVPPSPTPATPVPSPPPAATSRIALPVVLNRPALPDLVVAAIELAPARASYAAGEPVLISVTVANRGDAPATAFWVDLYLNPSAPPDAVNQRWNERCGLIPCYGIAWLVEGLPAGASVVLTSAQIDPGQSIWPGSFAPGTSVIYAYADTWNPGVGAGGVHESDETNNLLARRGLTVTGAPAPAGGPDPAALPPRPRP